MSEKLIDEIQRRLYAKTIHDIRQIARAVGVPRPADGRKERIVEGIMQIATGEVAPSAPSVRGAHPKSAEYDRQLVADIMRCREINLSANSGGEESNLQTLVASGESDVLDFTAEGILDKDDGKWFMRTLSNRESFLSDVYVNEYFVKNFKLREGDLIKGRCKRASRDELAGLANLISVNGETPSSADRPDFHNLTPVYPSKRLRVECGPDDYAGRLIDLLAPIGAGQRAIISAPHGAGKTALLKQIVQGLVHNNQQIKVILLLIDARPEEVYDFKSAFKVDVFASAFDAGSLSHIRTAELALEYSKRLAESGKDAVIILDDLTGLTRAYNSCGKQVTAMLDTSALDCAKKFIASARNTAEGGSLTIISPLVSDGDSLDEAIYSGLKDLGSMRVALSLNLTRMRVNPPFDLQNTCAYGDERLLNGDELNAAVRLRGMDFEQILKLLAQTKSNGELCGLLLR